MRIEMLCRIEIKNKRIFREIWDDVDEGLIEESFGGRGEHKKKKVRKNIEKRGEALVAEDLILPKVASIETKSEVVAEKEIEVVGEEREINKAERVEYLKTGLVPDMKVFYGPSEIDKKEATIRLDKFGVKTAYRSPTDKRKDYKFGNDLAKKLEEFLAIKSGFPKGWLFYGENLSALGIDINELQEARSVGTKENIVEKTKMDDLKNEVKEEMVPEDMGFEDKMKMVDNADYGGSLFPAFKKYINGESIPVGLELENVMSQIGKLFPFDVKKFAGEMRSRRENTEKPVVGWEGKYKNEPMFNALKQVVDHKIWQKKMEELNLLDELTRDNELKILMALIRIKSEGMTTVEAWRLWDSQNSKLEELGLMI